MISKPIGYDDSQSYTGDIEVLKLGGHICVIQGAEVCKTNSGTEYLKLYIDIAEGDQKGFYMRRWEEAKKSDINAKYGCTYTQFIYGVNGNSLPFFKGLIENIEKSNPGFIFDWSNPNNEASLIGKLIGGVFGREQYKDNQGQLKMATKCVQIRSVDAIRKGVEIPKDVLLENNNYFSPAQNDNTYSDLF